MPPEQASVAKAEERQNLRTRIQELAAKANDDSQEWKPEDETEWNEVNARYDRLTAAVRNIGREDRRGEPGGSGGGMLEQRPVHAGEFCRDTRTGKQIPIVRKSDSFAIATATDAFDPEDYHGLTTGDMLRALIHGASNPNERRALSEGLDTAGGYTVPHVLSAQMIDLMAKQARVMEAGAGIIPLTSDRNSFAKQTADPTPSWRGENQLIAESDPTFTQVTFAPKTLAVMVRVSQELLDDSVNIGAALQKSLARAMALELDRVALLGTGAANEPLGVVNLPNINTVSMGNNGAAVTDYTNILDAILAMHEDNAGDPTAAIMAPRTLRAYNGLEDTTGQPLMRPKSIENLPFLATTQLPITETQGSANNASSVVLGNFNELVIGMRNNLHIEVLKERFREYYQVGFLAAMRVDVQAWHDESFAKIVGIIPAT